MSLTLAKHVLTMNVLMRTLATMPSFCRSFKDALVTRVSISSWTPYPGVVLCSSRKTVMISEPAEVSQAVVGAAPGRITLLSPAIVHSARPYQGVLT